MMTEEENRRIVSIRLFLAVALALDAWALVEKIQAAYGVGSFLGHFSGSRLLTIAPVLVLAGLEILVVWLTHDRPEAVLEQTGSLIHRLSRLGRLNGLIFFALALVYPLVRLWPAAARLQKFTSYPFIFGNLVLIGAVFLLAAGWQGFRDRSTSDRGLKLGHWAGLLTQCLAVSLVLYGVIFQAALYLPDIGRESGITNYPLTLNGYSEASRYYFASLFFSKSLYGLQAPLPALHPTRYLLQSLPYIVPNLPIWFHRLWQILLWMGMTSAGAVAMVRRLRLNRRSAALTAAGWAFLFFFQGPIYYHLMFCAVLVLVGFDSQKLWRSLLVVGAASLWAGISRINWYPVPGLLAVVLYLIEQPVKGKTLIQYWFKPAVWAVSGLALAYGANLIYVGLSGQPKFVFNSSLTSSLLVYRLWPNVTYGPGIVLALVVTILPLAWLILAKALPRLSAYHPLRWLGIAAVLGVLLVGGFVVSIKIGGGSNLHNLDSFLLFMAVVASHLFFDRMVPDISERVSTFKLSWVMLVMVLAFPVIPLITTNLALSVRNDVAVSQGINQLQTILDQANPQGKEILFISERQLITFNDIHGVKLIPNYEMTFLMEMAMANNQRYFQLFDQDLKDHRFAMIITYPVGESLQDKNSLFNEENNVYVTHVNKPLLTYYQAETTIPGLNLQVLVPKP